MGVMARKQGESFIITSDRMSGDVPSKAAPRLSGTFRVWTGAGWSTETLEAKTFPSVGVADEYVRANYTRVMG
jgi:hypothetical protein